MILESNRKATIETVSPFVEYPRSWHCRKQSMTCAGHRGAPLSSPVSMREPWRCGTWLRAREFFLLSFPHFSVVCSLHRYLPAPVTECSVPLAGSSCARHVFDQCDIHTGGESGSQKSVG